MNRPMTANVLLQENLVYTGTSGISANAKHLHLMPAFQDAETGRVEIARLPNGRPATMHLIVGLPEEWAVDHDACGHISAIKASVVAGFARGDVFYTREQAAELA